MIVRAGRIYVRELIRGDQTAGFLYVGVGTGTTTETDNDTGLGTEMLRMLCIPSADGDRFGLFIASLSAMDYVGTTPSEWGLFTASSGGSMLLRKMKALSSAKTNLEELEISIKVEIK